MMEKLISDVLLWTHTYGWAKAGRPARTYIQQLCEDTGCSPEDLPEATNDREKWWERVRDIRASGTTRWWDDDMEDKRVYTFSIAYYDVNVLQVSFYATGTFPLDFTYIQYEIQIGFVSIF